MLSLVASKLACLVSRYYYFFSVYVCCIDLNSIIDDLLCTYARIVMSSTSHLMHVMSNRFFNRLYNTIIVSVADLKIRCARIAMSNLVFFKRQNIYDYDFCSNLRHKIFSISSMLSM